MNMKTYLLAFFLSAAAIFVFLKFKESQRATQAKLVPAPTTSVQTSTNKSAEAPTPIDEVADIKLPEQPKEEQPLVPAETAPIAQEPPKEFATIPSPTQDPKELQKLRELLRLQIDFPTDKYFRKIHIDDEDITIFGIGSTKKHDMFIFAAPTSSPPMNDMLTYVNSLTPAINLLEDENFRMAGEIIKLPPLPGSGFSQINIIPGPKKGEDKIMLIHMERADKTGSYLIYLRENEKFFFKEGRLTSFIQSIKVFP